MKVWEFEEEVMRIEEVLIRVRAPIDAEVDDYGFSRRASGNTSVTNWTSGRLHPRLRDREVSIIDGNYQHPHGRTKMQTLRQSYER